MGSVAKVARQVFAGIDYPHARASVRPDGVPPSHAWTLPARWSMAT